MRESHDFTMVSLCESGTYVDEHTVEDETEIGLGEFEEEWETPLHKLPTMHCSRRTDEPDTLSFGLKSI